MSLEAYGGGPLQMLVVGFETTERFRGDIAREIRALRGRGMIRVLDARLLSRSLDGELVEVDLNPLLADAPAGGDPVKHLLGMNGAGGNGHALLADGRLAHTAGFSVEDLRRLTDHIGHGEHAAVVLVEHLWASHLQETIREAGGMLLSQGMLTPEAVMIVGAELQAISDAQAAIELAQAARGAALLEALRTFAGRAQEEEDPAPEARAGAAAEIVRTLVEEGYVPEHEAHAALDALATRGVVEMAAVEAARAEAEDFLEQLGEDEPPAPDEKS